MSELCQTITALLIIWCVGVGLGVCFFGGLWWTVHTCLFSARPALWMLSSLLLRMGLTVGGFYTVLLSDLGGVAWQRLLLCLLGFLTARLLITRGTRGVEAKSWFSSKEDQDGS